MEEEVFTISITVSQPAAKIDGTVEIVDDYGLGVVASQQGIQLEGVAMGEISQTALIAFGQWYKGDKGDKGDPGEIKYGTTEYWNSQTGFVPDEGEIIIYTDKGTKVVDGETVYVPGIKVGSGNGYVQDLAFVDDDIADGLLAHASNTSIHVSELEKTIWNNKINVTDNQETIGETLIFNRN